jgi:L-fuconolactonase
MIVDAHHHLWHYRPGLKPWLDDRAELAPLRRDYAATDLAPLLAAAGVDRTVIVQAGDNLDDTRAMLDAAERAAFICGIVGWARLDDPKAAERHLDALARTPKVKGLRHMIIWESDEDWLVRPAVLESLRSVAERGYSWDSTATTLRHLEHVATVSERIPSLLHVIDHLGKPSASRGVWEPWATLMARAASYPNVYVKLSGLNNVATLERASVEQFRPYVEWVLEHFGAERVMIGSNWPVSLLAAGYAATWNDLVSLIAQCTPAERGEILGGTAQRFYRL